MYLWSKRIIYIRQLSSALRKANIESFYKLFKLTPWWTPAFSQVISHSSGASQTKLDVLTLRQGEFNENNDNEEQVWGKRGQSAGSASGFSSTAASSQHNSPLSRFDDTTQAGSPWTEMAFLGCGRNKLAWGDEPIMGVLSPILCIFSFLTHQAGWSFSAAKQPKSITVINPICLKKPT